MKKRSNSALYGIIAFLIIAGSFGYSWKVIVPQYQENQSSLDQADNETRAAKLKLESLKTAKTSLDQLGDIVNQMFIAIPEDKDTPNLITELEAVAAKQNIVLPSIQISDSLSGSATAIANGEVSSSNAISVSLSVEGSFQDLHNFIAALEKDIRFMNITSVSLTKASETGNMSLSIELEVYQRSSSSLATVATTSDSGSLNNNQAE